MLQLEDGTWLLAKPWAIADGVGPDLMVRDTFALARVPLFGIAVAQSKGCLDLFTNSTLHCLDRTLLDTRMQWMAAVMRATPSIHPSLTDP